MLLATRIQLDLPGQIHETCCVEELLWCFGALVTSLRYRRRRHRMMKISRQCLCAVAQRYEYVKLTQSQYDICVRISTADGHQHLICEL
jgi:hypothetical protein